jgi:hypothetical protein
MSMEPEQMYLLRPGAPRAGCGWTFVALVVWLLLGMLIVAILTLPDRC